MTHVPRVSQPEHSPKGIRMGYDRFVHFGGSQQFSPLGNGILLGQDQYFYRTTGHERYEAIVEKLFAMLCVEVPGQLLVHAECFALYDPESMLEDFVLEKIGFSG